MSSDTGNETRVVAVFEHARDRGRKPLIMAYSRDYNPAWAGCCLHAVSARLGGADAKRKAIGFHKQRIGCSTQAVAKDSAAPLVES